MQQKTVKLEQVCPYCQEPQSVVVSADGLRRWREGELIQRALPELSADERELLLTGICAECWEQVVAPGDDPFADPGQWGAHLSTDTRTSPTSSSG